MIDTDKYEGHTPAPWNVKHGDMERYGETDTVVAKDDYHEYQVAEGGMRQDAQLIADAPLLLEEVKRLREAIADIATNMEAADASYMGGFIEDLWKVIE